jgi:putative nucleotidyltransferase with HDIG domain
MCPVVVDTDSIAPTKGMPPKLAKVPPFPAVAVKLLSLLSDDGSSFSSLATCIATDPALSGRLINRANAADLANYCEVRNVLQAVSALGVDRTREVCLIIAMAGYTSSATKTEILQPCWHHTLACALIASELARQCGLRPPEVFTAALLHDIGRLGLLSAYTAEYEAMLAGAEGQSVDLIQAEQATFGVDHLEAGAWLAREWNLPDSLVEVIVHHHEPLRGALNEVGLVHVACLLADLLGFPVNRFSPPANLADIAAPLPEWMRPRLAAQLPSLKAAVLKEIGLSEDSESLPAGEATEGAAQAEEAPDSVSQFDAPTNSAALPYPRGLVVGAMTTAAILLLLAIVLFLRG